MKWKRRLTRSFLEHRRGSLDGQPIASASSETLSPNLLIQGEGTRSMLNACEGCSQVYVGQKHLFLLTRKLKIYFAGFEVDEEVLERLLRMLQVVHFNTLKDDVLDCVVPFRLGSTTGKCGS